MNTQTFYDRLRCCYLDTGNSNDAKAFFMRQILEDYFNFLNNGSDEGEKLNFASAQALWMERTGNYRLSREITYIRQELNKVVHRAKTDISNNTLRAYYEFTVRIINLISNDMPDEATMAAYGYVKDTYLNDLNEHQRDAVIDSSKIVYVNAGPGTGKTHLLVYKIIDLLVKERDNVNEKREINSCHRRHGLRLLLPAHLSEASQCGACDHGGQQRKPAEGAGGSVSAG